MPTAVNAGSPQLDDWEDALIAGNGRQGALVYGGPRALRVTVSHEDLFLPVEPPLDAPATAAVLAKLREHCLAGEYQKAADEVVAVAGAQDPRYEQLRWIDPFIGAATLTFTPFAAMDEVAWGRTTDFSGGLVIQGYAGGIEQRVFASRAHDVVVVELRGDVRGTLHLGAIAGAPPVPISLNHTATDSGLTLTAQFPVAWRGAVTGYVTAVRVIAEGTRAGAGVVELATDHALLLIRTALASATAGLVLDELHALPADVEVLLAAHTSAHRELMDRCRLALPDAPVLERLFEAGRYAIISASGARPPTLQGVWSGTFYPAWRSGYTFDLNLATAVAALGPTGTPELLASVADLLDAHRADFRDNARRLFGAPGFVVPPHLSTHGRHNHFGPRWCLTFWTAGAAWAARLYYDYWRYTGDREFLETRAWPFMTEAMQFYEAVAFEVDGTFCLAPSYSPENSPAGESGPQASINATHEIAAIRDLGENLLAASAVLGRAPEPGWQRLLDRLPAYQVGPDGSLREWLWPGLADNHEHRHASHLYGLWYEPDRDLCADPALRAAAAVSIRRRLDWWATAGDEMAAGLVSLGLAAAALGLADEAHETVQALTRYWRPSLVSTHNAGSIFNTDICGGLPALVVAMLVRGGDSTVDLLPALPRQWSRGRIEGVLLRGGIRIDELSWTPERIDLAVWCASPRALTVTVRGSRSATSGAGPDVTRFSWDAR